LAPLKKTTMGFRKIIHLDLDAFFCAVEELHDPGLRGKAFAVGGRPDERGVVASCSYAARQFGVRSAMPMSKALRLCPELLIVRHGYGKYSDYSRQVMAILGEYTALIEQISIDEAFLDLSDLSLSGEDLARKIQSGINTRLHLPCSLGVATNKLVAKIATDTGKARHRTGTYPNAILVVPPGEEAVFLAPLPAQSLWGIGPKTSARLADLGVHTIGDLGAMDAKRLERLFGVYGREIAQRAHGIDDSPVQTERETKSISAEVTFDRDVQDGERLRLTLREQSAEVAQRLREDSLCAGTVRIKLRWPDFTTHTRQMSLDRPTDQDHVIYTSALALFESIWEKGKAVRLLGVGASKLTAAAHQLSLWDTPDQKERRLLEALDELRTRFGEDAIASGYTLKRKKHRES
jgi:DNA polymerase-4